MDYTHLIIGGGMFGCYVALRTVENQPSARVAIVEREPDLLLRASYNNQARVHNGYHYPRSILTGLRSRVNAPRFLAEFQDCVDHDFEQYYALARRRSNITPGQFEEFCRRIRADLHPAPQKIAALFDKELIEAVYAVTEPVFNANRLRERLRERVRAAGIKLMLETEAERLIVGDGRPHPALTVHLRDLRKVSSYQIVCGTVFNCTYSRLNALLASSGLQTIRLRHEATEMPLIALPEPIKRLSVTVMCGPFFSLMPFPALGLATFSHVRYTPHYSWTDHTGFSGEILHEPPYPLPSHFDRMRRDSARYLPVLEDAEYRGSLWETKTILPQSDANDSRPILFKRDPQAPNVISLLGGKIDNVYDLDDAFPRVMDKKPLLSPA